MRIGVLGNCQAAGVADCIRAIMPGAEVTHHSIAFDPADTDAGARILSHMATCDVKLIQALALRRPGLEPILSSAAGAGPGVAVHFPMIAFSGFHPDFVTLKRGAEQIRGSWSAIAVAAWLEGLTPERTCGLFNAFTFAALGYFDEHRMSARLLKAHASGLGFDLGRFLTPGHPCFMHTDIHPAITVLHDVALQALAHAGAEADSGAAPPVDALASVLIIPVYAKIAERLGLTEVAPVEVEALVEEVQLALDTDFRAHGPLPIGHDILSGEPKVRRAVDFLRAFVIDGRDLAAREARSALL